MFGKASKLMTVGFVQFLCIFLPVACRTSRSEIEAIVDQRLATEQRNKTSAGSASVSNSGSASVASVKPQGVGGSKPSDPIAVKVDESVQFLASLDKLMTDYQPELPAIVDRSDALRCVTTEQIKRISDIAKYQKQIDRRKKDSEQKRSSAFKLVYPLQFHYDLDWELRVGKKTTFGCYDPEIDVWCSRCSESNCPPNAYHPMARWKIRSGGDKFGNGEYTEDDQHLYSRRREPALPELMNRMKASKIEPPERFFCAVSDVYKKGAHAYVQCTGAPLSEIQLTPAKSPTNTDDWTSIEKLNIGDILSVPLAGVRRDPAGVLFRRVKGDDNIWTIGADSTSIKTERAETCTDVKKLGDLIKD